VWYWHECAAIGETRAFWGVVYRLLDDPTALDIAHIRRQLKEVGWLKVRQLRDPTVNLTEEEKEQLARKKSWFGY
jgi:hypothetical protein